MIDWNTELANIRTTREQKKADLIAKKEAERLKKEEAKIKYLENCKVFDQVVQEEITGIRQILNEQANFNYEITITSGNVHFELEPKEAKFKGFFHQQDISLSTKEGIDLAEYTKEVLIRFVSYMILNCWGDYYYD